MIPNVPHHQTQKALPKNLRRSELPIPARRRAGRGGSIPEARGNMADRLVDLDLWEDGASERLPKITITGQGIRFEGTTAEFDRLLLILGGWLKL